MMILGLECGIKITDYQDKLQKNIFGSLQSQQSHSLPFAFSKASRPSVTEK